MLPVQLVYGTAAFVITFLIINHNETTIRDDQRSEVFGWLKDLGIAKYRKEIYGNGCTDLVRCAASLTIDPTHDHYHQLRLSSDWSRLPTHTRHTLVLAGSELRQRLILRQWLKQHALDDKEQRLIGLGITNLKDVQKLHLEGDHKKFQDTLGITFWGEWLSAVSTLPSSENGLDQLTKGLWDTALQEQRKPWRFGTMLALSVVIAVLVGMASTMSQPSMLLDHSAAVTKLGFLAYVTGKYLAPQNCKVEFDWSDPQVVGSTMTFIVKFYQRNGHSYPVCSKDNILVEITQGTHKVACSVELGGINPNDANKAHIHFSVRRAGEYYISILVGTVHIRGSPFVKLFLPGLPDPIKTGFVHHCSTVVCTEGVPYHLFIEPRDKYNNLCSVKPNADPSCDYSVDIIEVNSERPVILPLRWECYSESSRIALILKMEHAGCYKTMVSYKGANLKNGDFHIIVLNKADSNLVRKNVAKKSHNIWYEACLIAYDGDRLQKPKKVLCYISPKQLIIKEVFLKIIHKRLITFRLCPSTKFQFQSANNYQGEQVLVIDDGCQPQVELISKQRNVIAATFTQFLLKNIGGSETFKDKQDFFYHEIRKLHQKHFHDKLSLKISREKLLDSSMKCTKGFGISDWCKNFEITFIGEQGLDWGGLRREWFELVCSSLFDPENELFHCFKNDKQGLVHPNSKRPLHLKLKHYEFAGRIVGKCLYESALGSSYRQLVKARFSRSFLAQLIGLRVHYKYFEQDDPDLYVSKIKYILENDVEDMELNFSEEEYSATGQFIRALELIPNGSRIQVTNQNKLQYLDALAQHRLANSVKEEVEYFLKGLNDLIPDNLLCIFDENELELLMCGTGQYSIADFKANHAVSGSSYEFRRVLDWFWTAVSNFTEEEMARLLQFTTGCSQLPPGGFSELYPKFHITAAPTFGNLPTAHTCFNQLCLPDYDSYEQFEKALRLAINEGTEGFGMI